MAKFKLKVVFGTGRVDETETDDFYKLSVMGRLALMGDMVGVKEVVFTNNVEIEKCKNEAGVYFKIVTLNKDGSTDVNAYPPTANKEKLREIMEGAKRWGKVKSYEFVNISYDEYIRIETEKFGGCDE